MALRYAVATGNWSNTATWDGGTLPTAADDVFANNFIVTIDGTFTVLTIRNTSNASPVITAGGQFRFANGGNLTCTALNGIITSTTTPPLEMTLTTGNTGTFNGSVLLMPNVANSRIIRHSGTGTLNLNGNYNITLGGNGKSLISVTSTGTLNIVGDITSGVPAAGINLNGITMGTAGTINITGNVYGPISVSFSSSTIAVSAGTLNITGNTVASNMPAVYLTGAATYNQIGIVYPSSVQPAIYNVTTAATISVTGTVNASAGAPGIYSAFALASGYSSGTFVKVSGNVVNSANNMAIVAPRVTIDNSNSSWLFQTSTGGDRTLYAAGVALGNPATSNVRFGTTYGASGELTGLVKIPPAGDVLLEVGVDNTAGTLLMTPAQCWNYLISSGFIANSIGDRLQNASTVATTGGQLASYNI